MSKPGVIKVRQINSGIDMFKFKTTRVTDYKVSEAFVQVIGDLARIQQKLKIPINVPSRTWTKEKIDTINLLRTMLHKGKVRLNWKGGWADFPRDKAEDLLNDLEDGTTIFNAREPVNVELFGAILPLGTREYSYRAKLANEAEIRQELNRDVNQTQPIRLRLVPPNPDAVEVLVEFSDWLPSPHNL